MESIAASNGDTTSLPPSSASKKLTANRAIGFRRKARKLKEAELASTVTSSEEVKEDVEPRSELTVTISGTNDQDDTSTAANQPTPSGTDNTVTNSNRNFSNKKSKAKRSNKYGKSTKSLELDTNDTDVPTDGSGEDRNVNTSAMVTDTMTASNKQPKPKRAHPRGKRGNVMNKRNEKIESNQPAQIDEEDVADFVNEGPSLPSNKIVPVSDDFIQRVNRTTDSENNGRTLQSQSAAPKTPLHSRVSRMAPVVLPRLFSLPARSINTSDCDLIQPSIDKPVPQESSSKQLTSETPTKKAQDFARELPQMDRDLKRINKRQKRARNRNRNKSGTENAETNENSIDMTAFDSASPQPAASRPLPNHQPAILTYDQWKRLPVSKRYTPVTFKEKLAIHAIESIPEIFAQSTQSHAASVLPMINRMATSFIRTMELARIEAEKGVFNSSGQEEKTSIDHVDIMSESELKNFVSGMQEVVDPDKGGRVVLRRYWRLVGLKESERGVGSILTADLKEEKVLGRPSFTLRAPIEGVEGVLLCEARVDAVGVSLGKEWNAE